MKKGSVKRDKKGWQSIKITVKCYCTDSHRFGEWSFQVLHLGISIVYKILKCLRIDTY